MNADARGFPRIAAALLPRLIAAGLLAWSLATAWAWTITGSLEPATLDVDYFDVGAGNDLLHVRGELAAAVAFLAVAWAFLDGTRAARLLRLGIAPLIVVLLDLSVSRMDRTAPGFSDARFQEVIMDHLAGRKLSVDDVRRRVGSPLFVEKHGSSVLYSYTFTSSGGFGWHKRVLTFDPQGRLVDFLNMDEP